MAKKILVKKPGGANNLEYSEFEPLRPKNDEVTIKQGLIGVNFIDTYHRSGLYPLESLPFTPGMEAIGHVIATGKDVLHFKEGDQVCYGNGPIGSYCSERNMKTDSLIKLPENIKANDLAGMILRGLTVWYLVKSLHKLKKDETVLFHAAAGGVGIIFCQWAKKIGARVIGTVGSDAKAEIAKKYGCDSTILYRKENFLEKVMDITNGTGVSVVYDGVGSDTFDDSLLCLKNKGLMVSFGNASGPPPKLDVGSLGAKGSLFVTRPSLFHYTEERKDLEVAFNEIFRLIESGDLKTDTVKKYPLAQASLAHDDLEKRKTVGSVVLEA